MAVPNTSISAATLAHTPYSSCLAMGLLFRTQTLGVSSKTSADTTNYGLGWQQPGAPQGFLDCFFGVGQELSFSLCLPGEGCALRLKS